MRLIKCNSQASLFNYFRGVDNPAGWTLESPAVWHEVKVLQHNIEFATFMLHSFLDEKFMLAKFSGGSAYEVRSYSDVRLLCKTYDYLNLLDNPALIDTPLHTFNMEYVEGSQHISFAKDTLVLMAFSSEADFSLNVEIRVGFNLEPMQFVHGAGYYRDWRGGIGEGEWSVTGKLNSNYSLGQMGRRVGDD